MAILVSDDFNRTDDPTSLGTADTGQPWSQSSGASCTFGIVSNQAKLNAPLFAAFNGGSAWIEAGTEDAIVKATLVDVESLPGFAAYVGITARRENANRLYRLIFRNFSPIGPVHLQLEAVLANGVFNSVGGVELTPHNGDTIALALCGINFEVFHNDIEVFSGNSLGAFNIHGTAWGLTTQQGTVPAIYSQSFDNFLLTTNGTCTPTYNCVGGACVDPGDGSGTYGSLEACLEGCDVPVSYNCVDGVCVDPGDGSGEFPTLLECQQAPCGGTINSIKTMRFDAGSGSAYYLVAPVTDSGDELRSKTVKAMRATGRLHNASLKAYGYDVNRPISATDLERGDNASTRPQPIRDSDEVAQSARKQINVPNAVLHTVRIEGDDTGQAERDEIHEIVVEVSKQGVRR